MIGVFSIGNTISRLYGISGSKLDLNIRVSQPAQKEILPTSGRIGRDGQDWAKISEYRTWWGIKKEASQLAKNSRQHIVVVLNIKENGNMLDLVHQNEFISSSFEVIR